MENFMANDFVEIKNDDLFQLEGGLMIRPWISVPVGLIYWVAKTVAKTIC